MSASRRFVDWTLRYRALLWAVAIALAIPAGIRTGWLYAHLRSELEELLPTESPSVVALRRLEQRLGSHHFLGVVVDAGSREGLPTAERFLDAVAARLRGYPPGLLASVRTGNDAEATFLEKHGGLYVDLEDLKRVRARLEARRDFDIARASGNLLDDSALPPSVDVEDIRARYEQKLGAAGHARRTRYSREDRHLSVLLLELGDAASGASATASTRRSRPKS
jgi:hypothetical protein